jgi:hypothetical protein
LLNDQGSERGQSVVLAPSCDQAQWLSQKIWAATFYAASKVIIGYRLAVSGASNQDKIGVNPTLAQYSEMALPFDLQASPQADGQIITICA